MEITHLKKLITIIGLIVQNIWIEIKLYLNMRKSHDGWVILALQYFGHSGNSRKLDPNTPNSLGYIESIIKFPTPHSASNELFSLISILHFRQSIWFLQSIFQSGHAHWIKNREICQSIKICWSKEKFKRTVVSSTPSVPPSKPLPQYMACPQPRNKIYLDFPYNLNFKHDACEGVYF